MKKKIFLLVFAGFIFLFSSFASVPPVTEGPKQFLLISSRPDPTPEWGTTGSQENTNSLLYFVGMSGELHAEGRRGKGSNPESQGTI